MRVPRGRAERRAGQAGTGKTHLATAFGVRRSSITIGEFGSSTGRARERARSREGQWRRSRIGDVRRPGDLDELGYPPFSASGGAFHLLSKLYERTSAVITTNLSFSEGDGLRRCEDDDRHALDRLPRTHAGPHHTSPHAPSSTNTAKGRSKTKKLFTT
jgi:hypothetical protein